MKSTQLMEDYFPCWFNFYYFFVSETNLADLQADEDILFSPSCRFSTSKRLGFGFLEMMTRNSC